MAFVQQPKTTRDVAAVAEQIGIPYYSVNFEKNIGTVYLNTSFVNIA